MAALTPRLLDLKSLLKTRSVMLFGPRQCGKTTYIRNQCDLSPLAYYDLLDRGLLLELLQDPTRIRQRVDANGWRDGVIIIDEIQKCPELLDEVHLLIEKNRLRFVLTGSSARKLKRIGTNLLGGRARIRHFHPLTYAELREEFDLSKAMDRGLIPSHYFSDLPREDLRSYVGQYLSEEVAAEGLSRNIPAFARFLEVAATCSGHLINFSSVGSDAQVSRQTVQNYFQILYDTLVGYELPAFLKTKQRKSIGVSKFYLFDLGVTKSLRGLRSIEAASADYGAFFEHFVFLELKAWQSYIQPDASISYWRSKSGYEVDFIVADTVAIEVKASQHISDKHLRGLRALREEHLVRDLIVVCQEKHARVYDGIHIMPWQSFLDKLWSGLVVSGP